jgi:hypothetical protein
MSKIGSREATNHQESEQLTSNPQLNNNNMKLVAFDLVKYNSGNYNTVLGDGSPVTIGVVDANRVEDSILGWVSNGSSLSWSIDGINDINDPNDNTFRLYLTAKKTKVHITITRNKDGKINLYGSTEKEPSLKRDSELLKRLTVEV